jgi:7-carboxy-7-deazaguanine synthase
MFAVKEIFYTLQGEGHNTGRAAVFCRFAGCNLWSGLEKDRVEALCDFCDTDFVGVDGVGGGRFANVQALVEAIDEHWPRNGVSKKFVVCTGGEPLLQMTEELVRALHWRGFEIAIETNGTKLPPPGLDWICVSPKADAPLALTAGDELKLVFPQEGLDPESFSGLAFRHFFLQPMDGPAQDANIAQAAAYCLAHPRWRLSLQTHKLIGLP